MGNDEVRRLYLWRAWSANNERICDCGVAWGLDEDDAEQIARMALGGPYLQEVVKVAIESVRWVKGPHGRQVTTKSDVKR